MAGLFIGVFYAPLVKAIGNLISDGSLLPHFPCFMRIIKSVQKKSKAILMAFRSCTLTGKPELLLYLMCFLFWFPKVERSFCA